MLAKSWNPWVARLFSFLAMAAVGSDLIVQGVSDSSGIAVVISIGYDRAVAPLAGAWIETSAIPGLEALWG